MQILNGREFAIVHSRMDFSQILQFAQQEQRLVRAGIKARMRAETNDPLPVWRGPNRQRVCDRSFILDGLMGADLAGGCFARDDRGKRVFDFSGGC